MPSGQLSAQQFRARVDELYAVVVFDGKKPIFAADDPVEPIYVGARAVLDRYILNAWHADADGEYEIVHVLHDWLICNIAYDFELYSKFQEGADDLASDPAFHIDGVFLYGRAVCDGLSRAFNFLCAIENIDSVRVTGSFGTAPHAWNKVKLQNKWYNVDVTSDAAYYTVGGKLYKQLSHGYFLLSDSTIAQFSPNGHVFAEQAFNADADAEYYAGKTVRVGKKKFSAVVKSQSELMRLFDAIDDADGAVGKIEVRLDFPDKTQINEADMYATEIERAYARLDSPDFVFSKSSKPYFRYPNGVYLFLMYK